MMQCSFFQGSIEFGLGMGMESALLRLAATSDFDALFPPIGEHIADVSSDAGAQNKDVMVLGNCGKCRRRFSFHEDLVPSIDQHPVCRPCVEEANLVRRSKGMPAIEIEPGAYDEPFRRKADGK